MIVLKVISELGSSRDIQVAPNDFIAHVKSLCHGKRYFIAHNYFSIL